MTDPSQISRWAQRTLSHLDTELTPRHGVSCLSDTYFKVLGHTTLPVVPQTNGWNEKEKLDTFLNGRSTYQSTTTLRQNLDDEDELIAQKIEDRVRAELKEEFKFELQKIADEKATLQKFQQQIATIRKEFEEQDKLFRYRDETMQKQEQALEKFRSEVASNYFQSETRTHIETLLTVWTKITSITSQEFELQSPWREERNRLLDEIRVMIGERQNREEENLKPCMECEKFKFEKRSMHEERQKMEHLKEEIERMRNVLEQKHTTAMKDLQTQSLMLDNLRSELLSEHQLPNISQHTRTNIETLIKVWTSITKVITVGGCESDKISQLQKERESMMQQIHDMLEVTHQKLENEHDTQQNQAQQEEFRHKLSQLQKRETELEQKCQELATEHEAFKTSKKKFEISSQRKLDELQQIQHTEEQKQKELERKLQLIAERTQSLDLRETALAKLRDEILSDLQNEELNKPGEIVSHTKHIRILVMVWTKITEVVTTDNAGFEWSKEQQAAVQEIQNMLNDLETKFQCAGDQNAQFSLEKEKLRKMRADIESEMQECENTKSSLQHEMDELEENRKNLNDDIQKLEQDKNSIREKKIEINNGINRLAKKEEELEQKRIELEHQSSQMKNEREKYEQDMEQEQINLDDRKVILDKIQEELLKKPDDVGNPNNLLRQNLQILLRIWSQLLELLNKRQKLSEFDHHSLLENVQNMLNEQLSQIPPNQEIPSNDPSEDQAEIEELKRKLKAELDSLSCEKEDHFKKMEKERNDLIAKKKEIDEQFKHLDKIKSQLQLKTEDLQHKAQEMEAQEHELNAIRNELSTTSLQLGFSEPINPDKQPGSKTEPDNTQWGELSEPTSPKVMQPDKLTEFQEHKSENHPQSLNSKRKRSRSRPPRQEYHQNVFQHRNRPRSSSPNKLSQSARRKLKIPAGEPSRSSRKYRHTHMKSIGGHSQREVTFRDIADCDMVIRHRDLRRYVRRCEKLAGQDDSDIMDHDIDIFFNYLDSEGVGRISFSNFVERIDQDGDLMKALYQFLDTGNAHKRGGTHDNIGM